MIWKILIGLGVTLGVLWLALIALLMLARPAGGSLREGFRILPDTLGLLHRIAVDRGTPRGVRVRLALLLAYLALPIDLIPDFIPGIGYADDVIIVAFALRSVVRRAGPAAVRAHWPGTPDGLAVLWRLARLESFPADQPPQPVQDSEHKDPQMSLSVPEAGPSFDAEGRLIAGTPLDAYLIRRHLGSGASADIYEGWGTQEKRRVAIKVFRGKRAQALQRQEFQILNSINHPNVIAALHEGQSTAGWYLVTEHLEGQNLGTRIRAGGTTEEEALLIARDILAALAAIHPSGSSPGVVHRDLKPENVVLVPGRGAVLFDFDTATGGDSPVAGATPEYRPPEAPLNSEDPDLDLFALGIVLCELIAGQHPFRDRNPAAGPPDLSGVPDRVRPMLAKALAPERSERYATAQDFLTDINTLLGGVPHRR